VSGFEVECPVADRMHGDWGCDAGPMAQARAESQ
jgi:hypothetical protein